MEVAANDEINIEEVPKLIPTDLAIAVSIGAVVTHTIAMKLSQLSQ